jgi:hypothetical protein
MTAATRAAEPAGAAAETRRLARALLEAARRASPGVRTEFIETHISHVIVVGGEAWKIKKPVNLGFLDFTTLAARRHYCEEELRLNRRTAPDWYLDVIAIAGTPERPVPGGAGEPIEYAVHMRAFPQEALANALARRGALEADHVDAIAAAVAALHRDAARTPPVPRHGAGAAIIDAARENFPPLHALPELPGDGQRLARLAAWTERECSRLAPVFARRRDAGCVRECHGDLHLGNVAIVAGAPLIFDAIEFDPALRWIDVVSDVAFLYMDLLGHGLDRLAARFLDGWLRDSGDYDGIAVLRFYSVYRALVRAKVAVLRAAQPGTSAADRDGALAACRDYLVLAERLTRPAPAWLAITAGLPGSGKSTVALALAEGTGAVRLRSDVERKRLAGLAPAARTGAGIAGGIYTAAADQATYRHLAALAAGVVAAGHAVVVDATFRRRADRESFAELARRLGIPFVILHCTAPEAELGRRLLARAEAGHDASEATPGVLAFQRRRFEALSVEEQALSVPVDTSAEPAPFARALAPLLARPGFGAVVT